MLIHRIRLIDVLSFGSGSQELKLEPLNVLIGPNGSGKSNFIEAIGLLKAAPRDLHAPIRDGGGVHEWIWRGDATGGIAQVDVVLSYSETRALRYTLTFLEKGQRFRVNSEELRPEHPDSVTSDPHFSTDGEIAHVDFVESGSENEETRMSAMDIRSDQSIFAQVRGPNYPQLTHTAEQLERIRLFREWSFGWLTPAPFAAEGGSPQRFSGRGWSEPGTGSESLERRARDQGSAAEGIAPALRRHRGIRREHRGRYRPGLSAGRQDHDARYEAVRWHPSLSLPARCPMSPEAPASRLHRGNRSLACTPTSSPVWRSCFGKPLNAAN